MIFFNHEVAEVTQSFLSYVSNLCVTYATLWLNKAQMLQMSVA
jgi:hypothetical protein